MGRLFDNGPHPATIARARKAVERERDDDIKKIWRLLEEIENERHGADSTTIPSLDAKRREAEALRDAFHRRVEEVTRELTAQQGHHWIFE